MSRKDRKKIRDLLPSWVQERPGSPSKVMQGIAQRFLDRYFEEHRNAEY